MQRRTTKTVQVGSVAIGSGHPIAVQSMLCAAPGDIDGNIAQARALKEAGCDIVRLAIPTMEDIRLISAIKNEVELPLVADIQFDYRLAIAAAEAGIDKIRINPGNIGGRDRIRAVVNACRERDIPIRIGVNSGSLEKDLLEKYGGVTYWDTEAYCLPFYLATAGRAVARELLVYRYNQLDKAIENAAKLGFRDGAALYPMVTVNGEECHNEWEITFEEIHRNGAVAYAIFNYIRYTGDTAYLADCGLEVLLSVARFWAQRITWSGARRKYVMLGVTGPNEYENNVDNNWYTSYIACWSMRYAAESAAWVRENRPADYARICAKRRFDETAETKRWLEIADGMYFGEDRELGIFLQQDGYLDKEQTLAKDLDPADRPINQRWSWDRILRSCLIKQADVLQGLYFFGDDFDLDTVRRNFRFYEARTVHESSLSPCVHAILAARIGDLDKAYELYLRTARLDLDDYNREVREGCHVTSMAGSWLSVVEGFGGMRVRDGVLSFDPQLPAAWESLSFKVNFRDRVLTVRITRNAVEVANEGAPVELEIRGVRRLIADKVIMNCEL